jgi:hypothetical protein
MDNCEDEIYVKVTREYFKLRTLDKKDELLKYIEKVSLDGRFVWSDKKERLNGNKVKRWIQFYEKFSENGNCELSERDKGSRLPELLENYYNALINRITQLE